MRRLEKIWPWAALSLVALWPLLIINKGFDLTDTGFYLAGYRYAFSHPEFHSFVSILSTWLGGLIYHLAPGGQMLAIKIVAAAMYAAIAYWSFVILREHFPDWLVLLSLALASIYATFYFYSASYNTFSYFFLAAAIYLLYQGLRRERPGCLWAAAGLLGLNVFTRLPNLLQWALAAGPVWYYWIGLGRRGQGLRLGLRFCLVLGLSSLLFLGFFALATGPEAALDQFGAILGTASGLDHGSNHGALTMWDRYVLDGLATGYGLLAKYWPGLIGGSLALLLLILAGPRSGLVAGAAALAGLGLGLSAGLTAHLGGQTLNLSRAYSFPGFYALAGLLIGLAGLLYYHQKEPLLSLLSGMAMVVFLAMAVGSDFGVTHYLYYVHFSVTVCLGLVYRFWLAGAQWLQDRRPGGPRPGLPQKILVGLNLPLWFMLGLGLQQLPDPAVRGAYLDAPFSQTNTPVAGAPVLAGMRTNPLRAERLSRLSRELAPFRDMKILILGQCPLCLTLTDSEPFLKHFWIDLRALDGLEFERLLNEGLKQGPPPLVLLGLANQDPWRLDWRDYHKDRLLNIFLKKNSYGLYYDGTLFQIYLPPGRLPDGGGPDRS